MKHRMLLSALVLFISVTTQAQVNNAAPARRGLATVIFAGLGGAVLGLSTLSFYGEPQEHIGNIWTGLFLGAAAGGAYMMSTVHRPLPVYEGEINFQRQRQKNIQNPTLIAWAWDF